MESENKTLEEVVHKDYLEETLKGALNASSGAAAQIDELSSLYKGSLMLIERFINCQSLAELQEYSNSLKQLLEKVRSQIASYSIEPSRTMPETYNYAQALSLQRLISYPDMPSFGDVKEINAVFRLLKDNEKTLNNELIQLGERAIQKGNYDVTIAAYERAGKYLNPKKLILLGTNCAQKGNHEQAIKAFAEAYWKIKQDRDALSNLIKKEENEKNEKSGELKERYKELEKLEKQLMSIKKSLSSFGYEINEAGFLVYGGQLRGAEIIRINDNTKFEVQLSKNFENMITKKIEFGTFNEFMKHGGVYREADQLANALEVYIAAYDFLTKQFLKLGEKAIENGLYAEAKAIYSECNKVLSEEKLIQIKNNAIKRGFLDSATAAHRAIKQNQSLELPKEELVAIAKNALDNAREAYAKAGIAFTPENITGLENKCNAGLWWLSKAAEAYMRAKEDALPKEAEAFLDRVKLSKQIALSQNSLRNLLSSLELYDKVIDHALNFFTYVEKERKTEIDTITAEDSNLTDKIVKIFFATPEEDSSASIEESYRKLTDELLQIKNGKLPENFSRKLALFAFLEDYVKGIHVKFASLAAELDKEKEAKNILKALASASHNTFINYLNLYLKNLKTKDPQILEDAKNKFQEIVGLCSYYGLVQIFEIEKKTTFYEERPVREDDIIRLTPNLFNAFYDDYLSNNPLGSEKNLREIAKSICSEPNPFPYLNKMNRTLVALISKNITKKPEDYESLEKTLLELEEMISRNAKNPKIAYLATESLNLWEKVIRESKIYKAVKYWANNADEKDFIAACTSSDFEKYLPLFTAILCCAKDNSRNINFEKCYFAVGKVLNQTKINDPNIGKIFLLYNLLKWIIENPPRSKERIVATQFNENLTKTLK